MNLCKYVGACVLTHTYLFYFSYYGIRYSTYLCSQFYLLIYYIFTDKNNFTSLFVNIRTKPAITDEFEKNACSNELHAMAAYLDQDYKPIYLSEASKKYFKALEELDSIKNCPPNIDSAIWSFVIHSRNAMLSANMKVRLLILKYIVQCYNFKIENEHLNISG